MPVSCGCDGTSPIRTLGSTLRQAHVTGFTSAAGSERQNRIKRPAKIRKGRPFFGGCLLETGIIPRDQVTSRGVMIDAQAGLPVTRRRGRSKEAVAGDAAVL
jgi:hypothetical protein